MSTTIDQLQIEIESNSEGAVKGLSKLKSTLKAIDKIAKSSGLDTVTKKLKEISAINFSNLNSLNALGNTLNRVEELGKKVDNLTSSLSDVPDSIDITADTGGVADAISDISEVSDAVASVPESKSVHIDTPGAERATSKASAFRRTIDTISRVTSKASAGLKYLTARLSGTGTAFQKTAKKASMLKNVLKIVVIYGGAFRAFALLTQGVSEGLQNVAQYNSETAAAMSQLSTMALTLKNSIGAALYPVLEAITPVLNSITNAIARVCEAFGQLASLLSGKSTYLKAKKYAKSYVDTTKSAASEAAKAIKKSFAGMDEITTIGNKDSDSGSAGGGGGEDFGQMFEEVPIENSGIQALIPFFQGLGAAFSKCFDTIKQLANDYLYPWLVKIGNWCKDNPDALYRIGEDIGFAVANILAVKGTIGILTKFATLLSWISKNVGTIGVTLVVAGITWETSGILDTIKNGLNGLNFGEIVVGGGTLTLGASLIGKALGSAILGGAIGGIIAGIPAFGIGIFDAIKSGLDWLNAALIGAGATAAGAGIGAIIGMLGGPIGAGIGALIGLAVGLVTDLVILIVQNWESITQWCSSACATIGQFFVNLWNGIVGVWSVVAEWFNTWVIQPVVTFFTGLWTTISTLASNCWNSIVEFFSPAIEWFSELFGSIFQTISDIFYNIGVIASGCWEIIKAVWGVVSAWFNENIIQPVSQFFTQLWTTISETAVAAWEGIKSVFSTISGWINENIIQPVGNFFTDLWNGFTEKAAQAWEAVKTVFGNVAEFFGNIFRDAWQKIVNVFSVAGEIFVDIKDGVLAGFKKVANGLINGINKVVKIPFDGINSVLKWLRNISILDIKPFSGIKTISIPQIPTFATGGFPEDGLFMANHGELVGQFSDGRTAVANNEQIVEGIQHGVYAANQEQNVLLREQNKLLRQIVDKETNGEVNVSTITKAIERKNRRDGRTVVPVGI